MGFTTPEFRAVLATDLKITIDTEMSKAELNRAVQRTVDDLSRYIPLELVYEETLDFAITDESITTPAAASATYVVNAKTLNGESDGSTLTVANTRINPPRRLTITLTDANYSVTELAITVKGSDQDGHYIEESWSLPTLKVSGTAYQGSSYFSRITAVIVTRVAGSIAAGDTISVGTGNAYDSYIFLANKPIRAQSEEVTSSPAGTTYTRDTDYTMDYTNGAIKFINGGDMAAGTAYLVDYTKSRLGINIGSISPVLTRIQRVQYPVDLIPQQFVAFNIIGDFMYVAGKVTGQSQEELADKKHIAIYYERRQMPPSEYSPGSYPDVLDEVIAIGAAGYALLTEAQQLEQQAATDLATLRTELGLTDAIHTKVSAALVKVALYLETNETTDNAKDILANITDDAAELRTKIIVAQDAIATYLGKVSTTDLDASTPDSAIEALKKYEDKIDGLNVGARVGELGADYARAWADIANARVNAALGFAQEASIRLSNLRSYIEEAGGWIGMGQTFIAEAQSGIAEINSHLAEAGQWTETVNGDLVLADRFRAEGLTRLNEFHQIMRNKAEYRKRVSSVPVKQPA